MKILGEFLRSITNENSLDLMQNTSIDAIEKLRKIYYKVEGVKHNLVIAVYGSLARYEMLPMSDMDVLLFADDEKIVEKAKDLIKSLNFDYVDVPSKNFINLDNLKQFALSNSPDGHVAKLLIVAGSHDTKTYKQLTSVKKISNRQHLLLENLIFDYNYLNYRAKQKYTSIGENLKYSKGGTRDNLYFDWGADFLTKSDVSQKSSLNQIPQIKYSIPIICKYLNRENEKNDLLSCINFINVIKNQALLLKKQGGYFDGLMSVATSRELLYNYKYENIKNEYELITIHNLARNTIFSFREMLYNKVLATLRTQIETSKYCKHLVNIADMWDNNSLNKDDIIPELLKSGRWSDIASVVCQDDASSDSIDYAVDIALKNSAYSHLQRIAIRHSNTSDKTLNKILANNQIAGCEEIDKRYQKILEKRLEENER